MKISLNDCPKHSASWAKADAISKRFFSQAFIITSFRIYALLSYFICCWKWTSMLAMGSMYLVNHTEEDESDDCYRE